MLQTKATVHITDAIYKGLTAEQLDKPIEAADATMPVMNKENGLTLADYIDHDIVKLADVLGHASIETTRIYLITAGEEHQKQIDSMRLVL